MIAQAATYLFLSASIAVPAYAAGYLWAKSHYATRLRTVQAALLERLGQRRYNQVIREANKRIREGRGYG